MNLNDSIHVYPRGSGFQYLCNLAKEKAERLQIDPERIAGVKELMSESLKSGTSDDIEKSIQRDLTLWNKIKELRLKLSKIEKPEIMSTETGLEKLRKAATRKAKDMVSRSDYEDAEDIANKIKEIKKDREEEEKKKKKR